MQQELYIVTESSATAQVRRNATDLARRLGFDETDAGRVALVVSEAATNLVKHAQRGQLITRAFEENGRFGVEALALDEGPGIDNVSECMRDGYSTAGSPGTGLGAIGRQSDLFEIYSQPGKGTVMLIRVMAKTPPAYRPPALEQRKLESGVVCLPKPGEDMCGDAWDLYFHQGRWLAMVADGLGHGPDAAAASLAAVGALRTNAQLSPGALLEYAHSALRHTRGAAMAVTEFSAEGEVRFAGIGNISGVILSHDGERRMVSHNGIVGGEIRKTQEFLYPWPNDALLLMFSDGLISHWNLKLYPGLLNRHPGIVAGVIYRDFVRGRDDVTIIVIRRER